MKRKVPDGTTSIADLDPVPDLALICTPATTVPKVLEDCAARGIPAAVVLALGFAESGEAGARLEDEVRAVVQRTERGRAEKRKEPLRPGIRQFRLDLPLVSSPLPCPAHPLASLHHLVAAFHRMFSHTLVRLIIIRNNLVPD